MHRQSLPGSYSESNHGALPCYPKGSAASDGVDGNDSFDATKALAYLGRHCTGD